MVRNEKAAPFFLDAAFRTKTPAACDRLPEFAAALLRNGRLAARRTGKPQYRLLDVSSQTAKA